MDISEVLLENEKLKIEIQQLKLSLQVAKEDFTVMNDQITLVKREKEEIRRTWINPSELTGLARDLFQNEKENALRPKHQHVFAESIINFSLIQSFYSNKGKKINGANDSTFLKQLIIVTGFENLSKVFTLPDERTLRRKLTSIECSDGFIHFCLKQIEMDISENRHGPECILSLDEMAIKKGAAWDPGLNTFSGQTTKIEGIRFQQTPKEASKVLVFLLKGLDGKWEKIIGYFLTSDTSSGAGLAELVKMALKLTHEAKIQVLGLTFDGPNTNFNMAKNLGKKSKVN